MESYFRILPALFVYCVFSAFCGVVKTEDIISDLQSTDIGTVRLSSYITLVIGGCMVFLTFSAMIYFCSLLLEYKGGNLSSGNFSRSVERVFFVLMVKEVIVIFLYLQFVSGQAEMSSAEDIENAFGNEMFLSSTQLVSLATVVVSAGLFLYDFLRTADSMDNKAFAWSYSCFIVGMCLIQFGGSVASKISGYE